MPGKETSGRRDPPLAAFGSSLPPAKERDKPEPMFKPTPNRETPSLTVDPSILGNFQLPKSTLELKDASGQILGQFVGTFVPTPAGDPEGYALANAAFTDEQFKEALSEPGEQSLTEIITELEGS